MILSLPLLLPLLSCACARISVRQALVQESADGHIFITTFDAAGGAPVSPSTPARSSISQSATNSTLVSVLLSPLPTTRNTTKTSATEPAISSSTKSSSIISIYSHSSSSPTANLTASRSTRSTLGRSSSLLSHLASNDEAYPTLGRSSSLLSHLTSNDGAYPTPSSTSSWYRMTTIDPSSSGKSAQASPASSTSHPLSIAIISTASPYRTTVQASASASLSLSFTSTITSAPKPAGNGASLGNWPASVTYCLQSNGQPVIMVGYVTTGTNGVSTITNTSPSQSVLSATARASCSGEIAVFSAGTTTTIKLSTLPIASTFSQVVVAQALTVSGTPVMYRPMTLPGYSNTEPVEISTSFVETVNGQTTTQSGWWLIGPYGRIDPPNNRPWRTGSGSFSCIGGPLFCNAPCGDVYVGGGWFVHIPLTKCAPGITGPPGWPGGPIVFGLGEPINDLPPYPKSPHLPGKHDPSNCNKDGIECSPPTTTTTRNSISSQSSSDTSSKTPYFLIAGTNAVQSVIQQALQTANPESNELFLADVGNTSSSGGTWMSVDLTPQQASSMASRSDIVLVMTFANIPTSSAGPNPIIVSGPTTATLVTLTADTTTAALRAKHRRLVPDQRFQARQASRFDRREYGRDLVNSVQDLSKRDPGIRLVRQKGSPKHLSMLALAPWIPSVDEVDYVFQETKGENTWVYVVDTGMDDTHWDFDVNWEGINGLGKVNIDPDWIWAPGIPKVKEDRFGHGTCMASRVCGRLSGVAKQAIIIPAIFDSTIIPSLLAVIQKVQIDIRSRQSRGQALPGRTVVSLSLSARISSIEYLTRYRDTLLGIMNLGVVVVASAGNRNQLDGFVSQWYPAAFALWPNTPVIRVGAVDKAGIISYFSQQGDIYTVGVSARCALAGSLYLQADDTGVSGAVGAFAGLVAYLMGLANVPFLFGNDITQYQKIVKDYFVIGPGGQMRPAGQCRIAWNGLDGSQRTVCPLVQLKRQEQPEDICQSVSTASSAISTTSIASSVSSTISPVSSASSTISTTSSISPTTSSFSSAIPTQIANSENKINIDFYYSNQVPCYNSGCRMPFYAYRVDGSRSLPLQRCDGALGKGIESVQFRMDTLSGTGYNFIYDPFLGSGGSITGNFSGSVICSPSSNPNTAWACGPTKRLEYPDPTFHTVVSYHQWASCILNIS